MKNQPTSQAINYHINVAFCDYNILKDKLKCAKKSLKDYTEDEQDYTIVILLKKSVVNLTSEISLIKAKYNF